MVATLLLAISCVRGGDSIRLATIHQFEAGEILAGEEFKIFGDGFVPGDVTVVLDGRWVTPGRPVTSIELSFGGNAVTEKEISTVLPAEEFARVGARHALFEGEVRALFHASERVKPDWIEASRGRVVLDILGSEPDGNTREVGLEKKASRFLAGMGIRGGPDPDGGYRIESVEENGPAGRAGLEARDVLVVSRGMRVYSESDLLPPPQAASIRWVVARAQDGEVRLAAHDVPIPRKAATQAVSPVWVVAGAVALALVLLQGEMLALVFVPWRRTREWLARLARRLRRRDDRIVSLGDDPGSAEPPSTRWRQSVVALPVVIATASGGAVILGTSGDRIHLAAAYATLVVLAWFAGYRLSREGKSRPLSHLRRAIACLAAPVPVAVVLVWRGLFAESLSLGSVAEGQGVEPWTWYGLQDPFACVLLFVAAWSALLGERRDVSLPRHLAHQVYTMITCTVVAHVLLGGTDLQAAVTAPTGARIAAMGLFLFLVKVLAIYLVLMGMARERAGGEASDMDLLVFRPFLVVGAMTASVMLGPSMAAAVPSIPQISVALTGAAIMLAISSGGRKPGVTVFRVRPFV